MAQLEGSAPRRQLIRKRRSFPSIILVRFLQLARFYLWQKAAAHFIALIVISFVVVAAVVFLYFFVLFLLIIATAIDSDC